MRIVSITDTKEEMEFAHCAAEHMAENPRLYTFANGDPQPGKLFAIRWNPFTVLVVKLDEMHEPACYPVGSFIGKDLPPLKGDVCIGDSVAGRAAAEGSADETGESKIGAGSATKELCGGASPSASATVQPKP